MNYLYLFIIIICLATPIHVRCDVVMVIIHTSSYTKYSMDPPMFVQWFEKPVYKRCIFRPLVNGVHYQA